MYFNLKKFIPELIHILLGNKIAYFSFFSAYVDMNIFIAFLMPKVTSLAYY